MQGLEHKPTEENRTLVKTLSSYGVTYEDIALKLDISSDTLVKHYRRELDLGRIEANANISQKLYQQAANGSLQAQIFWLKTRARWKEVTQHEISGVDGADVGITVEFVRPQPKDEQSTVS